MDLLDTKFLRAAWGEAERAGLIMVAQEKMPNGWIIQQTWLDPIFAYCGAGA